MSEPIKDYIRKKKSPKKSITEHINAYKRNIGISSLPTSSRFNGYSVGVVHTIPKYVTTGYDTETNDYQSKGFNNQSNYDDGEDGESDAYGWSGFPEYPSYKNNDSDDNDCYGWAGPSEY